MSYLDDKISKGEFLRSRKLYQELSPLAKDFVEGLMNKNVNERLTVSQALKHPWLKHVAQDEPSDSESGTSDDSDFGVKIQGK